MINYFVIFIPGAGGNHLGNLISLDKKFKIRFDKKAYLPDMSTVQSAHTGRGSFDVADIAKNFEIYKNQNNIFCGHYSEFIFFKSHDFFDLLPNKTYFIMEPPLNLNGRGFDRIKKYLLGSTGKWLYDEIRWIYTVSNFKKLSGVEKNIYQVFGDNMFTDDIRPLLSDLMDKVTDLNIDLDQAQELHTKWIKKLFFTDLTIGN